MEIKSKFKVLPFCMENFFEFILINVFFGGFSIFLIAAPIAAFSRVDYGLYAGLIALLIIDLIFIMIGVFSVTKRKYNITEDEIIESYRGKRLKNIKLKDILRIELKQNFLQRIFKLGTIRLSSHRLLSFKDKLYFKIEIKNIEQPGLLVGRILNQWEKIKKEEERDFKYDEVKEKNYLFVQEVNEKKENRLNFLMQKQNKKSKKNSDYFDDEDEFGSGSDYDSRRSASSPGYGDYRLP